MLYLIDANVLITAHNGYYATNRVPEFWNWLLHHCEAGHVKMPVEMLEEIKDGTGNPEKDLLYAWVQGIGVKEALVLPEEVEPPMVQKVLTHGYGPTLTDVDLEKIGRDPFIVAHAMTSPLDRCVVTNEVTSGATKPAKRKIPDVCNQFGIASCSPIAWLRKLDFTTAWAPV